MLGEPDKPPAPPAVPGRTKILVSSVIFCVASVLLLLQFLALHCTSYTSAASCDKWVTGDLIDWSGAFSCIGWFAGFAVLIDWIVFDTFSAWGPSRRALIGATLKLMASAFFCVEPFSDIAGYLDAVPMPNGTAAASATLLYPRANGVPWSNFVGILFFHTGNVIDAIGMAPLFNCAAPLSGGNLPVLGMVTYMLATWLLAIGGGIAYAATPAPWGPGGALPQSELNFVAPAQIVGALLLLIGSILYTGWAACFGREKRARPDPLLGGV